MLVLCAISCSLNISSNSSSTAALQQFQFENEKNMVSDN